MSAVDVLTTWVPACPSWCEVPVERHQSEREQRIREVQEVLRSHGLDESPDPEDALTCHEATVDFEPGRWAVGLDAYENADGTVDLAGPDIYINDDSTLTCQEMDRIAAAIGTLSSRLKALGAA